MVERVADGVVLCQSSMLDELISRLKQAIPKTLSVSIHHLGRGRTSGELAPQKEKAVFNML